MESEDTGSSLCKPLRITINDNCASNSENSNSVNSSSSMNC